jgi:hypothetical protein
MTISAEGNPDKTQNCDGGNVDDDFEKIGTEITMRKMKI